MASRATLRILLCIMFVGSAVPARGQTRTSGALDVVREVFGLGRVVRGHVIQHREGTLVLRGEDHRTYTVNTAGLEIPALRRLRDGRPVTVTLKSAGGPEPDTMPIASAVTIEAGPAKAFRRVEGTVESVTDDRITVTTSDGVRVALDRDRVVGELPPVEPAESLIIVYEQEPRV